MADYNSIHTGSAIDAAITKVAGIEAGADVTDTANVTAAGALMDSEVASLSGVKTLTVPDSTTISAFGATLVDDADAATARTTLGLGSTDSPLFTNTEFAAIDATIAATAVDVFVYDTSKDSDGGAWRKRTQHTSWYNETLNTATRGSRREFPAVAVIVAEVEKVTIYDGDDPALPMWMVFDGSAGLTDLAFPNGPSVDVSVEMLNGVLVIGNREDATEMGVAVVRFIADDAVRSNITANFGGTNAYPLSGRNANDYWTGSPPYLLVNYAVNDVAMTVLPDAPIDPATGLPVPTIAVATEGGVSVIKDDGTVVDLTYTRGNVISRDVFFPRDGGIAWSSREVENEAVYAYWYKKIPDNDTSAAPDLEQGAFTQDPNTFSPIIKTFGSDGFEVFDQDAFGSTGGLTVLDRNPAAPSSSMVAYTTSTYNTGWMNGDIKGAFLADTDDADLVGGTDADRSVNGNDLTVNGTVTRTAVATGAELVAYSGFSATNYLEQAYNADLDFGTGAFSIVGWIKEAANTAVETILERDSATTAQRFTLAVNASGFLTFTCDDDTTARTATSTIAIDNGTWTHFAATYDGAGGLNIYLNGVLNDTETGAALLTLNNASAVLRVGLAADGGEALTNGSLALLRISATVPTADQIKKIYEDEKVLFQENAAATLYGASDAVTALAHDDATGLLHVGTSAGRSVFQGLRRVSNTTTAVGTAISAANNLIVEE